MRPANIVVNISIRYIQRVELILPSRNRDCRLITAQNDWDKQRSMSLRVFGSDYVLLIVNIASTKNALLEIHTTC